MQYSWALLAVLAELIWSIGIYIDKYLISVCISEKEEENKIGILLLISSFFCFVVAGVILIFGTFGVETLYNFLFFYNLSVIFKAILVGVLGILYLVPYLYALHYTDETVAPSLFQTIPIFGLILGFLFFNEIPTPLHFLASAIILLGALILNTELSGKEWGKRTHTKVNWKALALMLLASFIVALSAFLFKNTAISTNYWVTAFWSAIGSGLTGFVFLFGVSSYRKQFTLFVFSKNHSIIGLNILNEIFDSIATYLYYAAVLLGPSTVLIQSTVAYQPVFLLLIALILGMFGIHTHKKIYDSRSLITRSIGISIIVCGSLLIFVE